MKFRSVIAGFCGVLLTVSVQAAEVWAPGVSRDGGWYDYNKAVINDGAMADTAMCWAASASNVISWWSDRNAASITSSQPAADPWEVFRTVYYNVGGTPTQALNWWINGVGTDQYGVPDYPDTMDFSVEGKDNAEWYNGGFLKGDYDTGKYTTGFPSLLEESSPGQLYAFTGSIVNALTSGYALSISVRNSGLAHAYTLWGVEYHTTDSGNYIITKAWLTDSDDGQDTAWEPTLVEKAVMCTEKEIGSTVCFDEQFGASWRYVTGMRSEPLIPEPSTAVLGALALAALAARRRRA